MTDLISRLRQHLDGRYAGVRNQTRALLREELFHPVAGLPPEAHRDRVGHQMEELARRGIGPMLGYPSDLGGADDPGAGIAAFETMAFGDLSLLVKAGVQWGLFGGAVLQLGTERHHQAHGRAIARLELPGCFAMTETGHGSDVQSLRTTLTYDPAADELVVHTPDEDAVKDYIGNAARDGRMAVVFGQLRTPGPDGHVEHGVHAALVPLREADGTVLAGVTIVDDGHKAGLNGVDNGRISFDQVRIPRTNLLDRFGGIEGDGTYVSPIDDPARRFFTMLGTLVQGRTSISGAAISATKVALTIAVRYGETRRQFGESDGADGNLLLDYQAHQRLLLPRLARTVALHFAQADLVDRYVSAMAADDPEARREVESLAAGLKATTTWHCADAVQAAREACGGAGYLSENRLPALRADTDVFATFEGANTVLMQLVAKGLLTGYAEEFSSLDLLGSVRFATDKVLDVIVERLRAVPLLQSLRGATPSPGDDAGLRDRGWQLALLADREEHALETAAARLRAAMDRTDDEFTAFNWVQTHLIYAATTHMESLVAKQMLTAIQRIEDDEVRALLDRVAELHLLSTIEADRAWFLEHGRLTAETTKAITTAVDELCDEVRGSALLLTEAFGIPEEAIAAPIATGAEERRQKLRRQAAAVTS